MVRTLRAAVLTVAVLGCLRASALAQSQLGSSSLAGRSAARCEETKPSIS